ncbi:hypothetical protein [Capnocytophaga sp. HP1101]
MKWNNSTIFIALSVTYIALSYISSVVLNINGVMAQSLSEQLSTEQINEVLSFKDKWQWVGYVSVPVLLLIKISVTALLIDIGYVFYNEKLPYKQLFRMALLGEGIFLFVPIVKLCWFAFFQPNFTLEDVQYFYPLSALNITGYKGIAVWFLYPLQVLNLFELVYWLFMAQQLNKAIGSTTGKGLNIVAGGYGVGLLLWVVCVMFFTLNIS